MQILKDDRKCELGEKFAEILGLKKKVDGYYHTKFGKKNALGLFDLVMQLSYKVTDEMTDGMKRVWD